MEQNRPKHCSEIGGGGAANLPILLAADNPTNPNAFDSRDTSPPICAENDPFDFDEVLGRVEGDRLLLNEIIQMFLEDCPMLMADIRASLRDQHAGRLKLAAHSLRGAVGNLSAAASERAAQSLEMIGRSGDLTGADDVLAVLDIAVECLESRLREILATPG